MLTVSTFKAPRIFNELSHDFLVVQQLYDTDVNKEYAIRGNSAVMKCVVPSFVADFVTVVSWHTDDGEEFFPSGDYGKSHHARFFSIYICSRYFLYHPIFLFEKHCDRRISSYTRFVCFPTFVIFLLVVQQNYESEVNNEYVIRGNAAVLKCSIPSFVADFVYVVSWHDDQDNTYTAMGSETTYGK